MAVKNAEDHGGFPSTLLPRPQAYITVISFSGIGLPGHQQPEGKRLQRQNETAPSPDTQPTSDTAESSRDAPSTAAPRTSTNF